MLYRLISLMSKQRVYHKDGCPYLNKVKPQMKRWVDIDDGHYRHYRACRYCGGIRGYARIFHKRPERRDREKNIDCWYDDKTGYIFLKTKIGFWKVYWQTNTQRFLLFHRNGENKDKNNSELMRGKFHRQGDVSPTPEFDSLVNYVVSHDKNKEIASKDFRKLPQKTKQQKKIYQHYARKAKRDYHKHMDDLFESIKTRK